MAFPTFRNRLAGVFSRRADQTQDDDSHAIQLLAKSALATANKKTEYQIKPPGRQSRRFVGLKTFGLYIFSAWKRGPEQPKVAICQDRKIAAIRCLVHLVPVSGAIVLIYLNASNTFIDVQIWPQTATVLQFVAKLHEMLMVSSLAVVLLSYSQYHLTSERGLPFGAAVATFQAPHLSYLFSPELFGALRTGSYSHLFKSQLAIVLLVLSILIAAVGPASAACMIPRLGLWLQGKSFLNFPDYTHDDLFPTQYDLNRASSNWNLTGPYLGKLLLPVIDPANNPKYVNTSLIWPIDNATVTAALYTQLRNLSSGTVEATTSLQNAILASLILDRRDPWTLDGAMDAFANISCPNANRVRWQVDNASASIAPLVFDDGGSNQPFVGNLSTADMGSLTKLATRALNESENGSPGLIPAVYFLDLGSNTNTTGIVYARTGWVENDNGTIYLCPCTATLGWDPNTLHFTGETMQSSPLPTNLRTAEIRPTRIDPKTKPLEILPTGPEIGFTEQNQEPDMNWSFLDELAPLAISATLTTLLSVASQNSGISDLVFCEDENSCPPSGSNFELNFFQSGYGYGAQLFSVRTSMAILVLYCLVAVAHTVYSVYTGRSSTGWDSISEFAALCMGSHPSEELKNTSAGIRTAQVFEHKVRVAATTGTYVDGISSENQGDGDGDEPVGKHLELIFPSTEKYVVSKSRANAEFGEAVD